MPSTRKLADYLAVSRMTVILVYQELVARGYLEPLPRSGFVVSGAAPHRRVQSPDAVGGAAVAVDWPGILGPRLEGRRRPNRG